MITQFGLHDPQRATVRRFQSDDKRRASITFDDNQDVKLFTTPEMAERIKFAVNGPAEADFEMESEIETAEGYFEFVNCGFSTDHEDIPYDPSVGDMTAYTAVECKLLWVKLGGAKIPRHFICDMIGEARVIAMEADAKERATERENAA